MLRFFVAGSCLGFWPSCFLARQRCFFCKPKQLLRGSCAIPRRFLTSSRRVQTSCDTVVNSSEASNAVETQHSRQKTLIYDNPLITRVAETCKPIEQDLTINCIERAVSAFEYVSTQAPEQATTQLLNDIIGAYSERPIDSFSGLFDLRRLLAIYEFMQGRNIPVSIKSVRILVKRLYTECQRQSDKLEAVLQKAVDYETETTLRLYDKEMDVYDAFTLIFKEAHKNNCSFHAEEYKAWLKVLRFASRADSCLEVFQYFEQSEGYNHDLDVFSMLVEVFAENGDLKTAMDCYQEYKNVANLSNQLLYLRIYRSVLYANLVCKNYAGSLAFFSTLQQEWILPPWFIGAYVENLIQQGYSLEAVDLIEKNTLTIENIDLHTKALQAFADTDNSALAEKLYIKISALMHDDSSFDSSSQRTAMSAYVRMLVRLGDLETARTVYTKVWGSFLRLNPALVFEFARKYFEMNCKQDFMKLLESSFSVTTYPMKQSYYSLLLTYMLNGMQERNWITPKQVLSLVNVVVNNSNVNSLFTPGSRHIEILFNAIHQAYIMKTSQQRLTPLDAENVLVLACIYSKILLHKIEFSSGLLKLFSKAESEHVWISSRPQIIQIVEFALQHINTLRKWQSQSFIEDFESYGDEELGKILSNRVKLDSTLDSQQRVLVDVSSIRLESLKSNVGNYEPNLSFEITRLIREKDANQVFRLVEHVNRMFENEILVEPKLYGRILEKLAKEKKIEVSYKFFEFASKQISQLRVSRLKKNWYRATLLNSMIILYATEFEFNKIEELKKQMAELGYVPNANAYGSIIHYIPLVLTNRAKSALKLFNEAKSSNVIPSVFLYNATISQFSHSRLLHESLSLLEEMQNIGLNPTIVTYNAILCGALKCARLDVADDMLQKIEGLQKNSQNISVYPFNMFIKFFSFKSLRVEAMAMFERLREHIKPAPPSSYKHIMEVYAKTPPEIEKILELRELMTQEQVPIQSMHAVPLIKAYSNLLDFEKAWSIFQEDLDQFLANNQVDIQVFECISKVVKKFEKPELITEILSAIKKQNTLINKVVVNNLLETLINADRLPEALQLFSELPFRKGKFGRDISTYIILVAKLAQEGQEDAAKDLIEQVACLGYPKEVQEEVQNVYYVYRIPIQALGLVN